MKNIFLSLMTILLLSCCSDAPKSDRIKTAPQFSSEITDKEIKTITDEYFRLSKRFNLTFHQKVSIGFSRIDINHGANKAIGSCTYRPSFREIDLDDDYWHDSDTAWHTKVALLFHELTHCYCGREHDFGPGIDDEYPDQSIKQMIKNVIGERFYSPMRQRGYLDDNCPSSIMHPIVISNECFEAHYSHYVAEMFDRCQPF